MFRVKVHVPWSVPKKVQLSDMHVYYERIHDNWRALSYRRAISTLRIQPHKISFASEAVQLPYIGEGIAAKIEEIVRTGRVK